MIRYTTTALFILLCLYSNGQAGIKSSSINAAGGMKFSSSSQLTLINATSQTSSIKTHTSEKFFLRQGFIQPMIDMETFGMANISIFPNPTEGKVTIAIEGRRSEVEITLFNLQGRTMFSRSIEPNEKIDLTHLPKGLYHVSIKQYGSYLGTRKIIVQ